MDKILQKILLYSKESSRFHKLMFSSVPYIVGSTPSNVVLWTYQYHCMKDRVSQNPATSTLLGGRERGLEINRSSIDSKMLISQQKQKHSRLLYVDYFYFVWDCTSSTITLFPQR